MVGHRPGSDLINCSQCGESFTATAWELHGHNPNQSRCERPACGQRAVGFCHICGPVRPGAWRATEGGMKLCGAHLLEHRRLDHRIRIVDGSVCRVCGGEGQVQSQGVDMETPGGRWARCPHCQGSGYDPSLRDLASRRSPSVGPSSTVVRAEIHAAESWADRTQAVDEIAAAEEARAEADSARTERLRAVAERVAAEKAAAERAQRVAAERAAAERAAAERVRAEADKARAERVQASVERWAEVYRQRQRRKSVRAFVLQAALVTFVGAFVGVLFVFPLLPDAAASPIIELQQRVSEILG